ncbi:DUF551 domain-containing protein [Salmonella enterica subsp. enterica]|nr:DUF551 domain-containing protein [Salmonella enterica subsp. enterica serovar Give]
MTTITKERIELFIKNPLENGLTRGEQMELARIALASLEAEPVAYIIQDSDARSRGEKGILRYFANISDEDINEYEITVTPLYAAPPETVSVPDAMEMDDDFDSAFEHGKAVGWNAYRAAMFQSGNFRENKNSSTNNFREIAETSTNSPAIPDDWVMVPKEPTQAMIKAWLSEVANFRGHAAGYKAALAAAPKPQNVPQNIPENIPSGKSTLTPDGWISCSERMPAQDDWVLIYSKHGEYLAGQVQGEYVELNDGTLSWLGSALHWMLLPEPPQQEVK